jgi:ABC-type polysaccharide/polyol phosphate export permease
MADSFTNAVTDFFRTIATFVPKLVAFLLILVIGYFIAKAIGKAVDKVLERVGFDRAVERGGIKKALDRSSFDASALVGKLIYWALMLFVLQMAFGVFGPNPISDLLTSVIAFLPKVIVAIIIVVITAAIATAVKELISTTLGGLSYGNLLAKIAAVFVVALGVIAALNQVGIATTVTMPVLIAVLATVAGILIVGVGGGLVRPMQGRWEQYLQRMSEETGRVREQVQQAPGVTEQARLAKARYEGSDTGSHTGQAGPHSGQAGTHAGHAGERTEVIDATGRSRRVSDDPDRPL